MKLFIEIETSNKYNTEMKEDLADDILSSMGHNAMSITMREDINDLPELNDALKQEVVAQ